MSKLDLLNKEAKTKLERYLEPDMSSVLAEEMADDEQLATRFQKLNHTLATLVGSFINSCSCFCVGSFQCFDTVGWVTGRASSL